MSSDEGHAFWETFSRLMTEKGFTQKAVAKAVGISKQTIQDWKNKPQIKPKHDNLLAVAKLFRVPVEDLYAGIYSNQSDDGMLLPEPLWRLIVDDYLQSRAGEDTPALIAEKLYKAPHADFSRALVHAVRGELESKRTAAPKAAAKRPTKRA